MKWIKPFLLCAGGILLMAALTRLLIAAGNMQALALPDPLLGIPLRYAVLIVGAFELVVALICLFGRRIGLQIGWLAWLGTNYIVVWIGLLAMHIHPQATGIGIFTDPLQIHRGLTGYVFAVIPFLLALGSYAAAISFWFSSEGRTARLEEPRQPSENLKMTCVLCGGHVEFPVHAIGQKIPCPHCAKTITLLKPT